MISSREKSEKLGLFESTLNSMAPGFKLYIPKESISWSRFELLDEAMCMMLQPEVPGRWQKH